MDVSTIIGKITSSALNTPLPSPEPIPTPILLIGAENREGISSRRVSGNIISRFPEIGALFGPLPDGSDNIMEKFIIIMFEEFVREIQTYGRIEIAIPSGIPVESTGESADGAPVQTLGITTEIIKANGIIR